MPIQPSAQAVISMLERISDPLLVFNVAGAVTYANRAARQAPGSPQTALSGHPQVREVVRAVALGTATLPHHAKVTVTTASGSQDFNCTFIPGLTNVDVAVMLPPPAAAAPAGGGGTTLSLSQIIELLRSELMGPVRELLHSVAEIGPSAQTEQIERASERLNDRLRRLIDLVNVFGDDTLLDDNRVEIPAMVRSVVAELAPEAARQKVRFVTNGDDSELPPLYGSEKLLKRALRECLENAMRHSRREVKASEALLVEIRYLSSGNHLLLSVNNRGASSMQQQRARGMQAFAADEKPAAGGSAGNTQGTPQAGLRIGLPLAKRIVELHGGQVRVGDPEADEVQVLMELPTGAPNRGGSKLDIAQAQKYAADLARLMSRQRKERA
ncbi:MAG: hypothetical protein EBU07_09010 [Betaproteobacteria bacterium]|nr:hypothetical protein [Betaproteobacteria bacterium]NBS46975.1 hypothetical protein [Betaproteobacteria bacterium]